MAVTLEDIAVELGRATPSDESIEAKQWQRWIDRAGAIIDRTAREHDIDPSSVDGAMRDTVVTLAVAAHVRKPDNSTQTDVAIDDGRVSKRYSTSTGEVTITDLWWSWLGLSSRSGAFTVLTCGAPDVDEVL